MERSRRTKASVMWNTAMKAMPPTLVSAKSIGIRMTPNQPNGTGGDETEDTFSDLETNEPKIDLRHSLRRPKS